MSTLAQDHDCLLLDLDGTVFRGHEPTPGAVETLAVVRSRILFVTNNASRGPAEVAKHLCAMGFTAKPDDIVTSAQSAARLLAVQLQPAAAVLIVGTDALAAEIQDFVRQRLSAHEYPREVAFIDTMPMTTTGKVIRRLLRLVRTV